MFKTYEDIINHARSQSRTKGPDQPYYELHHILPRYMGGTDAADNLVLLTIEEHVWAHYFLALMFEETNKQYYHANLNAAWLICHGKSIYSERKREEVETWLQDPAARELTLKLKEGLKGLKRPERAGFDPFGEKPHIWVGYRTQKPRRILETSRNSKCFRSWEALPDCPICHGPNSSESFACCKEHEEQYLRNKREEYRAVKSEQTRASWRRTADRELRLKNNNGKHGPREKHVWITNGTEDRLILATEAMPEGFNRGRSRNMPNGSRKATII